MPSMRAYAFETGGAAAVCFPDAVQREAVHR
jgi:hypothetical protein